MKGVMRFDKKGKLSPRYVGPYKILRKIGKVVYELELPAKLASVHSIFHISLLKKCVGDPASIVPLESVVVKDNLTYEDMPVEILDRQIRRLRNKEVISVKVLWMRELLGKQKQPCTLTSFLLIPLQLERICMFLELSSVRNQS
ncbi:hypothetical protein MTR67_034210 [Solanum verrucosum]|uniref:Tf2-1-like SH3-like domain-containing protein n=1 Tax=Solanum verrucosum TaxID=315347 RepID=A0AAF0U7B3_SOLVR|nr:hypothetical protein MTR67_034210 [Solanum verrucosum]